MLDLGDADAVHIGNFDANNPLGTLSFTSFQFADGSSLTCEELLQRDFDFDGTPKDDLNIKARRVGAGKMAMDRKFDFQLHRRHGAQVQHWRIAA